MDYIRTAIGIPKIHVADCQKNLIEMQSLLSQAQENHAELLLLPELCITGYTCGDLFFQSSLLQSAMKTLYELVRFSADKNPLCIVGLPLPIGNQLYNAAAVFCKGELLGIAIKTYLPNFGEFSEKRWFSPAESLAHATFSLWGKEIPVGNDLLFTHSENTSFTVGVELCEDLWNPLPPSSSMSLNGATILCNLSASNDIAGKSQFRLDLAKQQSSRCHAAYLYASSGEGESTQDVVFGGHSFIFENGILANERPSFQQNLSLLISDIDLSLLQALRIRNASFRQTNGQQKYRSIFFSNQLSIKNPIQRNISPTPFVPTTLIKQNQRAEEIVQIQAAGLASRMAHVNCQTLVLGISGGLDSTLALLVAVEACRQRNIAPSQIIGVAMPGFGTTNRTYRNALGFMKALGITVREIPIQKAVLQHFSDIGQDPTLRDAAYENSQARERTQILMDIANMENGIVVGTGDLSELALGFATYNGDHMSMYGVNAGVPKTLLRVIIRWLARSERFPAPIPEILADILNTPISPELLPPSETGEILQKTEETIGPYELHDFFLYYMVRFGFSPSKIFGMARQAFSDLYPPATILKWMEIFYRRFFTQQFKRSCLPDGPKVGSVNLSPRGDWRMPSDAKCQLWLEEIKQLYSV